MALIFVQALLEFVWCQPVRLVRVIQSVCDFTVIVRIVRVAQLENVGNEFGLLLVIQQCHGAFDLVQTHKHTLALHHVNARPVSR
jgi:hypothetical protein